MSLYILLIIPLLIVIISGRLYFVRKRKRNIPVVLFVEALRNENDGHFKEAVFSYERALLEAKKNRSQKYLETRITEKLKILHSTINYENSFHSLPGITKFG
ncbi:MAG: hypothetical protein ABIP79_01415 [Chitinophagaceae bacterium]